nr:MAG TPA: hypothetical protein [Caudoviricetes sp.]
MLYLASFQSVSCLIRILILKPLNSCLLHFIFN